MTLWIECEGCGKLVDSDKIDSLNYIFFSMGEFKPKNLCKSCSAKFRADWEKKRKNKKEGVENEASQNK